MVGSRRDFLGHDQESSLWDRLHVDLAASRGDAVLSALGRSSVHCTHLCGNHYSICSSLLLGTLKGREVEWAILEKCVSTNLNVQRALKCILHGL